MERYVDNRLKNVQEIRKNRFIGHTQNLAEYSLAAYTKQCHVRRVSGHSTHVTHASEPSFTSVIAPESKICLISSLFLWTT